MFVYIRYISNCTSDTCVPLSAVNDFHNFFLPLSHMRKNCFLISKKNYELEQHRMRLHLTGNKRDRPGRPPAE